MLVYKCDGSLYSTGSNCSNEAKDDLPERWLTIVGKIKNGLRDAHYIEANGTYHFCSRRCFENFLFKDLNATSAITGDSVMNNNYNDPKEVQEEVKEDQTAINAAEDQANEALGEPTEAAGEGALVD